jgi:hypothetical protein
MKFFILLSLLLFSLTSYSVTQEKTDGEHDIKRVELGVGLINGYFGKGAKIKYKTPNYLIGVELNLVSMEGSSWGTSIKDENDESGDHPQLSITLGKDWSHSFFSTAVDIGIGYSVEGKHTNCKSSGGSWFFSGEVCAYDVHHYWAIPMSATLIFGKTYPIGLSLTHEISGGEYKSGFKIVVPFGTYN